MNYTSQYINDLHSIKECAAELASINECKVLVTGANGLIGSAVVDFLLSLGANITVYAGGRSETKIKKRFCNNPFDRQPIFVHYDANEMFQSNEIFDYVIHGASNADPKKISENPTETMAANFIGTLGLLRFCLNTNAKRLLFISSSEVYGRKDNIEPFMENDYGFLDLLNPRACYPSSKRAAETLCVAYSKEYNVDTVIVRPGHVYGPTLTDNDSRASSLFAKEIAEGKDIVMKSRGTQLRSYCYVIDCVSAIMTVLLKGKGSNAYNISNPNSIVTIRQMADAFAKAGERKIVFEIPTESEKSSYNLMDNSSLNSDKLIALGWKGKFDMQTGALHTIDILKGK